MPVVKIALPIIRLLMTVLLVFSSLVTQAKKQNNYPDRYQLHGIEGSLFNDFSYDSALTESLKAHHFRAKDKAVTSYNYKGRSVTHSKDATFIALYFLRGSYKGKSGLWMVFEYPDQSVVYGLAHRMVWYDSLVDVEAEYQEKKNKAESDKIERNRLFLRNQVLPRLIMFVITIVICFMTFYLLRRSRLKRDKKTLGLLQSYIPSEALIRIEEAVPFVYTYKKVQRTGTYSGTIQGSYVNVRENIHVTEKHYNALRLTLRNQSPETLEVSLSYNYFDSYGAQSVSESSLKHTNIRPGEPFTFFLLQPKNHSRLIIRSLQVYGNRRASYSFDADANNKLKSLLNFGGVKAGQLIGSILLLLLCFGVRSEVLVLLIPINLVSVIFLILSYRPPRFFNILLLVSNIVLTIISLLYPLFAILSVLLVCLQRRLMFSPSDTGRYTEEPPRTEVNFEVIV